MEFIEVAKSRYTTKKYDASKKVSDSDLEKLKEILRLSPSSINSQPWKFTIVGNQELKEKLAEASYFNAPKLKDGSHVVVFSAVDNVDKFEKDINEYLPEGAVGYFNTMLKPQGEDVIKNWFSDQVYLSIGYFLSAVGAMGIDSTPMEGIDRAKYKEILGLEGYQPLVAVMIGYRDEEDGNQPSNNPKSRLDINEIVEVR
ncbi:nitroreductase family protein [Flammeovirga kamogawensis]|uniref:Nitroreductase family protein n=1 Tax=Flammeovirga kamogawensis TaxID=373891 RepID=A0ABX8GR36_9BACT|nr:nitroreductase family protein [Flammeovirga kamogawensis]MBB6462743.1 nitroreductase/dihydropteridine reductase [Flammeovirga kamogawensis]QWG06025.1 nitroreductase family protein [Flammeovirga kamogawensis]TRX67856.1 NAD(P)H-dependent oxidoreductase [Flammeovirga kamogawensis]